MNKAKTLVIKSNKLIGMQTQLSLVQMKIFALLIARTLENPKTEYYRFSTRDLMSSCNFGESNYTALQQTTANMIKPVIFKGNKEEQQKQYPLLDGVVYNKGTVDIAIHRLVKPFILDVATKYTKYYFENISALNSTYSIRLYELLKEFEFRGARDFTIENFRFLLNIKEGMYSRPYDLKTKVIEKAQNEIAQKTDIHFSYQEKKEGRKLVGISFRILSNSKSIKAV
jgi:plasmid replication initiation protein